MVLHTYNPGGTQETEEKCEFKDSLDLDYTAKHTKKVIGPARWLTGKGVGHQA